MTTNKSTDQSNVKKPTIQPINQFTEQITNEKYFEFLKPATHLAILYADRGEFDRKRFSPPIDADTPGDFFRRSRRCGSFENSCDKIAQPGGLALLATYSNYSRKSREWAHLANAGKFNRRYLTCQISAILDADRDDRRIKSPSVSLALVLSS